MVALRDELAHPGRVDRWELHGIDPSIGLTLDVVLVVSETRAGVGIVIERPGGLVAVIDPGLAPPRRPSLELRGPGVWLDLSVGEPSTQVTVGLEAFGIAVDSRDEIGPDAHGHRVAVGLDVDWVVSSYVGRGAVWDGDGYRIECQVEGEVLLGDERLLVSGDGWRSHRWDDDDLGTSLGVPDVFR